MNNDWYIGEANGRKGLVPASFVRIISDADVSTHSIQAIVVGNFVSRNTFELDLTAGTLGKYPTQLYHLISHQSDCCSVHGAASSCLVSIINPTFNQTCRQKVIGVFFSDTNQPSE